MGEEEFRVRCVVSDDDNGQDTATEAMKKAQKVQLKCISLSKIFNFCQRFHVLNFDFEEMNSDINSLCGFVFRA